MRHLLAVTVVLAGIGIPAAGHAQRMGGGRSFGPAPVRGGVAISSVRPVTGPVRIARPRITSLPTPTGTRRIKWRTDWPNPFPNSGYWPGTPCLNNPTYSGSFFCRQHLPRRGFGYFPFYGLPLWYGLQDYSSQEQAPPPAPPEQDTALAAQVEHLAEEVELLRETHSSPATPPSPAATAPLPPEEQTPAVLVYRDGHKGEVDNYAVLGQTLYVFEGKMTRRISLADLDLGATQKINEERGIQFVPSATP